MHFDAVTNPPEFVTAIDRNDPFLRVEIPYSLDEYVMGRRSDRRPVDRAHYVQRRQHDALPSHRIG